MNQRFCLYLDSSRVFRWHLWLAEALTTIPGCEVSVMFALERRPLPRMCSLVFEFERLIYGSIGTNNAIDAVVKDKLNPFIRPCQSQTEFDVLVDFVAGPSRPPVSKRILTPCFNNFPGEIGAISGLINESPLLIEVHDSTRPALPWTAHPAVEDHSILSRSVDNTLSAAVSLIVKAIMKPKSRVVPMIPPIQTRGNPINPTVGLTTHTFGTITEKIGRYLTMLLKGGKYWSVGWRICPTPLLDTKTASFSILGDDGHRAYADPFPMCRDGQDYLFVEEFPFATQRGCISVATIENGQISTPRPVLEEPWHLSYPFVFEHAGEVWMIPESGNAHGIYLYRADPFPYRWTREGCLIDGIDAHDSTLLYYEGRFWLFVCEKVQGSSAYDILSLFYADKLAGPWLPHTDNPVLFDATLSRPAGAMFLHDGHIIRPTQDCSHGYGGAVTLCHVNALTESSFCQSIIGSIRCESRGCHTYNMASRITKNTSLEVIDTFGRQRGLQEITAFHASCILGNPE